MALNKALEALERASSSSAATSETLALYGRALLRSGHADLAERTLQQATERYPVEPAAFTDYADAAEQQNHLEAARQALLRYGALAGDDEGFSLRASRLAAIALKMNDNAAAAIWIARALERDPDNVALLSLQRRVR